jgi:hypothetical protein
MKTLLTLFFIICCCTVTGAQNELEQVRYLYKLDLQDLNAYVIKPANHFTIEEIAEWRKIKKFVEDPVAYVINGNEKFDYKIVAKILERKHINVPVTEFYVGAMGDGTKNALNGNLGAQFTSQLIFALSDLIIDRAKSELTLQYFTKLKNSFIVSHSITIPKPSGSVTISFTLKELFPNSYSALEALLSENTASLVSIGQSFKSAFEADMKQFYTVASTKFIAGAFSSEPYYKYIDASLYSINELLKGSHPSIIIQNLAFRNPVNPSISFSLGINFLYVISESLKNTTTNTVWVGQDVIDGLSEKEFIMYFSLLYLNNKTLFTHLSITSGSLNTAREMYYPLIKQIGAYVNLTQSFLNEINDGKASFGPTNLTAEQKNSRFYAYAHNTIDLIFISKELVCKCFPTYCSRVSIQHQESAHLVIDITKSIEEKDYSSVFRKSFKLVESLSGEIIIPPAVTKIAFMASDIASADSIQQIKKILDGAILPVGSFRIKRQSEFSVHLNAYPGMSAGIEFLDGGHIDTKGAAHVSPFLPVGFDISWGKDKRGKIGRQSNGLFLSIVDLGAVVSYRIQNQDTNENSANELPDIKWSHLLAPGAFYVHGIRNSPLSWGLGANINPSLREISNADGLKLSDTNAIKFSFFLAVDIPLFNISSR